MQVTPLQLATLYCTIGSGGVYHRPHMITKVESFNGRVLEEVQVRGTPQGMPQGHATDTCQAHPSLTIWRTPGDPLLA